MKLDGYKNKNMELIGLHIVGYSENEMVTICYLLDNTELHSVGCASFVEMAGDNINQHHEVCVSFVERMDAPTIPSPTRKLAVCGWGDNTCVDMHFYKANTHTSWCTKG